MRKMRKITISVLLLLILLTISSCNIVDSKEENIVTNPNVEGLFVHIDDTNAEYYFSPQIKNSIIDEVVKYNNNIIEFLSIKEKSVFVIQDSSSKIDMSNLNSLNGAIINIETYRKDLFDFNLEKTFLASYSYLTEFFAIYFEKINYVIEDINIDIIDVDIIHNEVEPQIYSLDQIFSFDKINSKKQIDLYNDLVLDFINNMLRHLENNTTLTEIKSDSIKRIFDKNKADLDLFLSKVQIKWLEEIYENNNMYNEPKYNLSKLKYIINLKEVNIITQDDNLVTIDLNSFNKEIMPGTFADVYYFYEFINSVDIKKNQLTSFLNEEDLYENYSKRTVIEVSSNQDESFANRGENTIYLSIEGVIDSFLHELTHALLKEHGNTDITTDHFRSVYEEGFAEYIQFTFDENTLLQRNLFFLHSNNNERFSNQYKREALLTYLNYVDGSLVLDDYVSAAAYLSLTDNRFLEETTKRFSNSENTALRTYEESHSYVKYIINTYGEEAFFKLRRREESYQDIFKKSYLDILNEWLDFLKVSKEDTTLNMKEFENILG